MIKKAYKSILSIALFCIFISALTNAQTNWYIDTLKHSVKIEYSRADYAHIANVDYGGFGLYISGNYNIGRRIWIVAEIPYANSKTRYDGFINRPHRENSYKEFGNPYLGIKVWDKNGRFYNDVGIRYPFSDYSDRGYIGGGLSNLDKSEAFEDDYISLEWTFNYIQRFDTNIYPRLYLGPLIYFPKSRRYDRDTELFLNYGFDIYIDHDYLGICFGAGGISYVTYDDSNFDNSTGQLGFGPNFKIKNANFGLRINAPLDESLNRYIEFTVNAYIQLKL